MGMRQSMVEVWTHENAPPCLTPASLGARWKPKGGRWEKRGGEQEKQGLAARFCCPLGCSPTSGSLSLSGPPPRGQPQACGAGVLVLSFRPGPATRPVLKREQVCILTGARAYPQGQEIASSRQGAAPVLGLRTWVSHPASGGPALPLLQGSPRGFTGQGRGLPLSDTLCSQGTCPGSSPASHCGGRPVEGYCGQCPGCPAQPS